MNANSAHRMLYPTLLIISPFSIETTQKFVSFPITVNHPDVLQRTVESEKQSIGIDDVHEFQHTLTFKPFSASYKIGCIYPAEKLTLPAQQALLKVLEEPPENTQLILFTTLPNQLLPTVRSRCVEIQTHLSSTIDVNEGEQLFTTLQSASIGDCIRLAQEKGITREIAIQSLFNLLSFLRIYYVKTHQGFLLQEEKEIIHTVEILKENVNVRLALEHCFFSFIRPLS